MPERRAVDTVAGRSANCAKRLCCEGGCIEPLCVRPDIFVALISFDSVGFFITSSLLPVSLYTSYM